jgi:UDP-N-acetylmuramoyl-L-alanyl-D-glutamate--2,6-diaminopimelate ligase
MNAAFASLPLSSLLPDLHGLPGIQVQDLSQRSSTVGPGTAFVALRGGRTHGLEYAAEALGRGATAVLWDEDGPVPADDPRYIHVSGLRARLPELARRIFGVWPEDRPLIAITGTDGKTSVSHQVSAALTSLGMPCAVIGTLGVGIPGSLAPTGHTTPDVLELHRHLAGLAGAGFAAVALEASSHALAQGRLDGLHPTVAVLTQLGRDHLDFHGSVAAYAEAKARLFEMSGLRAMVLNMDDDFGRRLHAAHCTAASAVTCWSYGFESGPEFSGRHLVGRKLRASEAGLAFELEIAGFRGEIRVPLFGAFHVANLLATAGTLLALGESPERVVEALRSVRGVPGRMERFALPAGPALVVDYAHTALALESALRALRPHTSGRLWVVFGCGGERDPGKRPEMGAIATRMADAVIVTDDNPRHENPAAIRREILAGCAGPAVPREIGDRAEAIRAAVSAARPGDVVLIAGKGHETTQNVGGIEYPFSDRELAARYAEEGAR